MLRSQLTMGEIVVNNFGITRAQKDLRLLVGKIRQAILLLLPTLP